MKLERAKGTRDSLPEEAITKQYIVNTLKEIFELYGFSPTDTPAIERWDILSSKDTGGSEIMKETFRFKDQGKRDLGLRYDMTVPFARIIAMNPTMKLPFKRYQISKVWRDGPISTGRYREFTQADIDIVGCKAMTADTEIISITNMFFKKLDLDFNLRINNRKLINGILAELKIPEKSNWDVLIAIDKLDKMGEQAVIKELVEKRIKETTAKKLLSIILKKQSTKDIIKQFKDTEGIDEVKELFKYIDSLNLKADLDLSLARGLAYYTGTVFEVTLNKSKITSSVAGGGRYDDMISKLAKRDFPAVGISFGIDRIYDAYIEKNPPETSTTAEYYLIPIGTTEESMKIAEQMRNNGKKVDIDLLERGPSKNIKYANALKIPYTIFIGEEELKKGEVKIKDMKTGKEKTIKIKDL